MGMDAGRSYDSFSMEQITVEKIIEIHDEVILNYDGASGILSESTLDYLMYRLNRNKHVSRRAALALHAIGSQHPFIDGNKRTGRSLLQKISLDRNGCISQWVMIRSWNLCWELLRTGPGWMK